MAWVVGFVAVVVGACAAISVWWVETSIARMESTYANDLKLASSGRVVEPWYGHQDRWRERTTKLLERIETLAAHVRSLGEPDAWSIEDVDRQLRGVEGQTEPMTEAIREERLGCMAVYVALAQHEAWSAHWHGRNEARWRRRLPDRWRLALLWRNDYDDLCRLEERVANAMTTADPVATVRSWPDINRLSLDRVNGNGVSLEVYVELELTLRAKLREARAAIEAARAKAK